MADIDGDRARKVHSPRLYTILPLTLNEIVDWGSCGGAPLFDIKWRSGQETMPTCDLAAIGAEVGIIGSLNWTRGHRILRGNEGGGIRRRDSQAHVVLLSSGPRGSVAPTAVAGGGGRADREATQAAEGRNSPLS